MNALLLSSARLSSSQNPVIHIIMRQACLRNHLHTAQLFTHRCYGVLCPARSSSSRQFVRSLGVVVIAVRAVLEKTAIFSKCNDKGVPF